jgi:hypothetical protein
MLQEGFRCVGMGEHGSIQELEGDDKIPKDWNKNQDVYTFRFKHYRSSMTFVIKFLPLGKQLLIHAQAKEEGKTISMDLQTIDFVISDALNKLWSGDENIKLENLFKDLDKLESLFKINITRKLLPELNKEGYEESVPESTTTTTPQQVRRPPMPQQPFIPAPQPPQPDFDPLRIGPPRFPTIPNYGGFGDFGVGGNDLMPQINPPLYIGRGGFGGSGGNLIGPNHPGFGPTAPNFGNLPQGVPPGARFDPYAPPGTGIAPPGRGNGRGRGVFPPPNNPNQFGPTPDHERPPQNDDFNPYFF